MFVSEKCVLFFEKSEVIFTKWCFIFVLFFDKSDYDHWNWVQLKDPLCYLSSLNSAKTSRETSDGSHLRTAP